MSERLMKIPIAVTYRITNGEPVAIEKEYADILVDEVARMFVQEFKRQERMKEIDF